MELLMEFICLLVEINKQELISWEKGSFQPARQLCFCLSLTEGPKQPDGYRYSVVYYALKGMKDCFTHAVETAYALRKRTEREQSIAHDLKTRTEN